MRHVRVNLWLFLIVLLPVTGYGVEEDTQIWLDQSLGHDLTENWTYWMDQSFRFSEERIRTA